jgi:hypothetical protein
MTEPHTPTKTHPLPSSCSAILLGDGESLGYIGSKVCV